MRTKRLTALWMLGMEPEQKAKMTAAATLARLYLREGLPIVTRMLRPSPEDLSRGE